MVNPSPSFHAYSRPLRTSETHPIHVDFLTPEATGLSGQIGMTLAPGKCNHGMAYRWIRDLDQDLARLQQVYGVNVLVTLLEAHEMPQLQIAGLLHEVERYGMRSRWFPIPDFSTPPSLPEFAGLVHDILTLAGQGETVVIHCKAGLGRSGLVAASCLVALGHNYKEAFLQVRRVRPGTIETPIQEAYVESFANFWKVDSLS
ncbi:MULTISPECIES: cyclin-dependent kinase inhibitor 3 family protein [unclassified Leptolyngbya]|uniref:cyclin-dependent kinase inhibitor 3 family protein n=1 Tax=unclassified Leptolyngbya TaxID=2650499 RepID=UPI0016852554|nr:MULTISPECIES: cyclin-dependent kinase inhibitor 3 family protein [unclassified Leptolyngbya]MBD1910918.1 cyclin-dependent kinase inhibitor 3 family protein [Leptolyngbya sp. FACHB-8]MBD2154963.1 cyclin-dependent kinase inhibitor 3 family protein [Leptolyngbya sp. FACHB-16]